MRHQLSHRRIIFHCRRFLASRSPPKTVVSSFARRGSGRRHRVELSNFCQRAAFTGLALTVVRRETENDGYSWKRDQRDDERRVRLCSSYDRVMSELCDFFALLACFAWQWKATKRENVPCAVSVNAGPNIFVYMIFCRYCIYDIYDIVYIFIRYCMYDIYDIVYIFIRYCIYDIYGNVYMIFIRYFIDMKFDVFFWDSMYLLHHQDFSVSLL